VIARLAAAVAALAFCASAAAHETTLLPSRFETEAGAPVTLALSSMAEFPTFETGPKPERIMRAVGWVANVRTPVVVAGHTDDALRLSYTPPRAGLAVVAVSLGPRDIDLEPDKIAEYFAEIDPPATVRAALPDGATLHETYTKCAKALVCVAPCADARAALRPLGDALEFVPEDASLRTFRLVARGRSAADVPVIVWRAGAHAALRTDAAGHFSLPGDMRGPVMLSATILRPPASPGARFTSDFATLTFDAR
jgi:hypothetical protein